MFFSLLYLTCTFHFKCCLNKIFVIIFVHIMSIIHVMFTRLSLANRQKLYTPVSADRDCIVLLFNFRKDS